MSIRFNMSIMRPALVVVAFITLLAWGYGCGRDATVQPGGGSMLRSLGSTEMGGSSFDLVADPREWQFTTVNVKSTLEPFFSREDDESRQNANPITQGKVAAIVITEDGDVYTIMRQVQVPYGSHSMLFQGRPVTSMGEIFTEDEMPGNAVSIDFYLFFDQPAVLEVSQVLRTYPFHSLLNFADITERVAQAAKGALAKTYKTDSGHVIKTTEDPWPTEPNRDSIRENAYLVSKGLKDSVKKIAPPTDSTNCWGWTFTCGSTWISNGSDVDSILKHNGYTKVDPPQPGDVAVYRKNGKITHTGIVRSTGAGGTKIESKWGRLGRYLHSPTAVPPSYGDVTYYRTKRPAPKGSSDPDKDKHTLT